MRVIGLIVPDVHEQIVKLKKILKRYKDVEWIVFVGDFMDSFSGLTWETFEIVKWLAENARNPKYVFIFGNHDLHYAFPIEGVMCSGWDKNKLAIVQQYLTDNEHWKAFKLHHWIGPYGIVDRGNSIEPQEWLLSHAGIHPSLLHPVKGFDKQALQDMAEDAMWKLRYCQQVTSFVAAGRGRGGIARVGGIDWLDWETEFTPIEGLNQIVGHSFGKEVRVKRGPNSINYCIDTHLNHVVEIREDGSVKVVKVKE